VIPFSGRASSASRDVSRKTYVAAAPFSLIVSEFTRRVSATTALTNRRCIDLSLIDRCVRPILAFSTEREREKERKREREIQAALRQKGPLGSLRNTLRHTEREREPLARKARLPRDLLSAGDSALGICIITRFNVPFGHEGQIEFISLALTCPIRCGPRRGN